MRLSGIPRVLGEVREIRRRYGIPYRLQWSEYRRFHGATSMSRGEFLRYRLWDLRTPVADRMAFISSRERVAAERLMNPEAASWRLRDKAWATDALSRVGVATGEVLALIALRKNAESSSLEMDPIFGEKAVAAWLRSAPAGGIVIKPNRGGGGTSVYVFREVSADGLTAPDGTRWPIARLLKVLRTESLWKVERRLVQHPTLAKVSGPTVGTLRMLTFLMRDGSVNLGPTVWKIPIGDSGVDHFMHGLGQYAAPVDDETGQVGPARRWVELEPVDVHPTTGQQIRGVTIPHWELAKVAVRRGATCFPEVGSIGWDVAVTADGPVVIEANVKWAEQLTQAPGPRGLVTEQFRQFLEERGCAGVVNLKARDRALGSS